MYKKLLIVLLLIGTASAANFGSTTQKNSITIKENQSSEFTLLFWTADNETQKVRLILLDKPDNFSVFFDKEIEISRAAGSEMVFTQDDYIAATPVKVFFEQSARPGSYNIIISATKTPGSGEILFAQERVFNLTVIVEGESKIIEINIPIDIKDMDRSKPQNSSFMTTLIFGIIIFISYMIYRYS